jgi:uncharacterized repeat protein (TIGR03803 family)
MRSVVLPFALFVLVLILSAASPSYGGNKEFVLHNFGRNKDGLWPYGPVTFGRHGRLYGTSISGGAFGYGAVFELKPGRGGRCRERVLHNFQNNGKDGYWPYAGLISDAAGNFYGTTASGGRSDQGTVFELTPQGDNTWKETILYNFAGGTDGARPYANLIFDASGNLYGPAYQGGNSGCHGIGCGLVFELTPGAHGKWTETVLHVFQDDGVDGHNPYAGLIFDSVGNLYGTTAYGPVSGYYYDGPGTVFELTPTGNGQWIEAVLFTFCPRNDCSSGENPFSNLILDSAGNLYGTTEYEGVMYGNGTVFELSPGKNGQWTEKVLYTFCPNGSCQDGRYPFAGVIFDVHGNLWGTTSAGTTSGSYCGGPGCGIVFKLVPGENGTWTERIVHSFRGDEGGIPYAGLVSDTSGNLYGTTTSGGGYGNGTVFEITR